MDLRRLSISTVLNAMREGEWSLAAHADFEQDGKRRVFWLWTHPYGGWIRGEGATDRESLLDCIAVMTKGRAASASSPPSGGS